MHVKVEQVEQRIAYFFFKLKLFWDELESTKIETSYFNQEPNLSR